MGTTQLWSTTHGHCRKPNDILLKFPHTQALQKFLKDESDLLTQKDRAPLWAAAPSANLNSLLRSQYLQYIDCPNPEADSRHTPAGPRPILRDISLYSGARPPPASHPPKAYPGAWLLWNLYGPFVEAANPACPSCNTQVQIPWTPFPPTNEYPLMVCFHQWPLSILNTVARVICVNISQILSLFCSALIQRLLRPRGFQWPQALHSLAPCIWPLPCFLPTPPRHTGLLAVLQDTRNTPTSGFLPLLFSLPGTHFP